MAVTAAPRTGITRWSAEADPFNRTQTDADHALLDDLVAIDLHDGTLAARPAVGIRGRYYTESAASAGLPGATWRDTGTAWRALGSRVLSIGTTDVAQVVAGVTGQTANLQEWRAGASTLGHVDNTGQLFTVGAQLGPAPQTALPAMLGVTPTSAAAVAAIVRGAVSQSADLQQWQDSTAAAVARITNTGSLIIAGASPRSAIGNAGPLSLTAFGVSPGPGETAVTPLGVRGVASQSADLQQWQNSAATVLARVDSTGAGTFAGLTTAGTVTGRLARWSSAAVGDIPVQITGFAGQAGNLTEWRDSTNAVLAHVSPSGYIRTAGKIQAGSLTDFASVTLAVTNAFGGGTVGAIVRGATGGTGDLQQWQDSTGAVLGKVTSSGGGQFSGAVVNLTTGSQLGSSTNLMQPGSTSQAALVAKGLASQSGSLQQWQDSTGAVLASMSPAGQLTLPTLSVLNGLNTGSSIFGQVPAGQGAGVAFLLIRDSGGSDIFRVHPNGQVFSQANTTTTVTSVVKGFLAQSADLQEWQNSSAVPLATMNAGGQMWASGGFQATAIGAAIPIDGASSSAMVGISNSSNRPGVIVRANASQSRNLIELQDSTGAFLAALGATGSLTIANASPRNAIGSAGALSLTALAVSPGAGEAGVIPLALRGVASQTADLQQWQSSAGTVLGKIGPAGGLVMGGAGVARTSVDNTFYASGAGTIPLAILGATSASAALTRWSVANDTTVAAVTQTGNVQGTGAYTTLSDAAVKRNVRALPHDSALAVIRRLRPQLFDYIDGERDQVGFVAQQVAQHLPHAVVPFSSTGRPYDYDRLGVRSEAIVAYLVAAVQELAAAA